MKNCKQSKSNTRAKQIDISLKLSINNKFTKRLNSLISILFYELHCINQCFFLSFLLFKDWVCYRKLQSRSDQYLLSCCGRSSYNPMALRKLKDIYVWSRQIQVLFILWHHQCTQWSSIWLLEDVILGPEWDFFYWSQNVYMREVRSG